MRLAGYIFRKCYPALVAMIIVSIFWVRSRLHDDGAFLYLHHGAMQSIGSTHGTIRIVLSEWSVGDDWAWTADWRSVLRDDPRDRSWTPAERMLDAEPHELLLGFNTWAVPDPTKTSTATIARVISLPHWFALLILSISPIRQARYWLTRQSRLRRGCCVQCGYDLRASAGVCPECGRQIA